jgi:hypothetical protein
MADQIPARGAPEPKVVVSEAAPAPSSSLQTQDIAASASKANSPAEIRALIAQAKPGMQKAVDEARRNPNENAGKPVPDTAPDLAAAAAAEETPAAGAAEEGAETTEETPAEGGETPEGGEGDTPDEEGGSGEGPVSPITGKRAHLRLPPESDKVGRLALSIAKRNQDLTLEEAMERARTQLGIKPKDGTTAPATQKSDLPETVEAVDGEIERLETLKAQKYTALEFEEVAKIEREMRKLDRHRITLEKQAERQEVEQAAGYDRAFSTSEAQAAKLYDFADKPESPGGKRMAEIDADLQANGDPLFHSPDKPLRIAQMVAAELKIAPRRPGKPAAPATAAAPATGTPTAKKQVLPGGGSRTTPPPVNQPSAIDTEIKGAKSVQDIRNLRRKMGLPI